MVKNILLYFIAVITIFCNSFTYATTLIGVKGGYFIWRPFLKDFDVPFLQNIEPGAGVLAGPILSQSFGDSITFSVVGLFGKQGSHWDMTPRYIAGPNYDTITYGTYYLDQKRYDIDATISYQLTEIFKVFAGYKYQYLDVDMQYTEVRMGKEIDFAIINYKLPSHGPALGIGLGLPLSDIFFATANVSFLYALQSKFTMNNERLWLSVDDNYTNLNRVKDPQVELKLNQYGFNFEPGIGAKISQSLIVTLGARAQWLILQPKETMNDDLKKSDTFNDYVYGVFVSVIYIL